MRNYIEFFYDEEDNFIAKIHKAGKVRTIRKKENIDKLIEIAESYGYKIDKECYLQEKMFSISRQYEEYIKKKNKVNILGLITNKMKVSRKNPTIGKTIMTATLAAIIAISGATATSHMNNTQEESSHYEIEVETENVTEPTTKEDEITAMLQVDSFHYSYEDRRHDGNMDKTKRYEDLFEEYGNRYGIDSELLMAIAAQESAGDHYGNIDNGPAEGIMQVEKSAHIGTTTSAYNFETGEIDTIEITEENLQNLETNIQIGTMLLRNCIEDSNYNIPLAIQKYNFGPGNMYNSITMYCELEGKDRERVINDPTDNGWLEYRAFLNTGDSEYIEHVFSRLDPNIEITVLDRNNNPITVLLTNDYQKENTL